MAYGKPFKEIIKINLQPKKVVKKPFGLEEYKEMVAIYEKLLDDAYGIGEYHHREAGGNVSHHLKLRGRDIEMIVTVTPSFKVYDHNGKLLARLTGEQTIYGGETKQRIKGSKGNPLTKLTGEPIIYGCTITLKQRKTDQGSAAIFLENILKKNYLVKNGDLEIELSTPKKQTKGKKLMKILGITPTEACEYEKIKTGIRIIKVKIEPEYYSQAN